MLLFTVELLFSHELGMIIEDPHEILVKVSKDELFFFVVLLEVLLCPFPQLDVAMVEVRRSGDDHNSLEASSIVIGDRAVKSGGLAAAGAPGSYTSEGRFCQMLESRLSMDHLTTGGWLHDRLFVLQSSFLIIRK